MPIFHAYTTTPSPAGPAFEPMYSAATGAAFPNRSALPMPAAGVLAEFAAAWQGGSLGWSGTAEVILNGIPTGKVVPMSGASGFALPVVDPVIAFALGAIVKFKVQVLFGSVDRLEIACVVRPAAGQATHARIQMGVPDAAAYGDVLNGVGRSAFEIIDAGWLGTAVADKPGFPLLTGFLIPVPVTVPRFITEVSVNSLNAPASIALWDALGAVQVTPLVPYTYAPAETGVKDAGPLVIAVPAGKVLVVRGDTGASAGELSGPVRATALLDIPA